MTFYKITSLSNPKLKKIIQLRNRKDRDHSGETVIEGYRELLRAVEAGVRFDEFYYCPQLLKSYDREGLLAKITALKIGMFEVDEKTFEKIAYGERKEGCLAVGRPKAADLKSLTLSQKPFLVVVEGVEKPGNLGAMMRICDGAGIDGVIVCDSQTDIFNPNVIRASLGTIFSVKVAVSSSQEALNFLKSKKIKACAATPQAKNIYTKENLNIPLAIVVGSEEKGLSDFWMKNADVQVQIPMKGKADSLNVSASSAILLYEALRQREQL